MERLIWTSCSLANLHQTATTELRVYDNDDDDSLK
jgi:hypothetical protein